MDQIGWGRLQPAHACLYGDASHRSILSVYSISARSCCR